MRFYSFVKGKHYFNLTGKSKSRQPSIQFSGQPKWETNKLSRDKFTEEELIKIDEALDCDYEGIFTLRDFYIYP